MATVKDMFKVVGADLSALSLFNNRYIQTVLTVILLGLMSGGMYFGYSVYRLHKNKEAQKILSVCLEEYMRAMNGAVELWPTVEMNCQLGYDQHKGSSLAPYFLAVKIKALVYQGKHDEVQKLTDVMMRDFSPSSPLYHIYQIQEALIQIDSDDVSVMQKGLDTLKRLSEDKKSDNRDLALYYLGLYHWSHNQVADAQDLWQELVDQFATSPWAHQVSIKLKQIV